MTQRPTGPPGGATVVSDSNIQWLTPRPGERSGRPAASRLRRESSFALAKGDVIARRLFSYPFSNIRIPTQKIEKKFSYPNKNTQNEIFFLINTKLFSKIFGINS
ncbi:hypothetical protein [Pelagibius sp.]|uniref:hypothetical protein n=1 Tax=Pelagibius sp. TaxID=1931238 RepID=UPI003B50B367